MDPTVYQIYVRVLAPRAVFWVRSGQRILEGDSESESNVLAKKLEDVGIGRMSFSPNNWDMLVSFPELG